MYNILQDAYSYDTRNKKIWEDNWKESDEFFYDNPEIAEKYGLVTCVDGEPIGFVTWDPRNRPEYVEIGHNGIREKYKRQGYGHRQLEEAVRRIKEYEGLKRAMPKRRQRPSVTGRFGIDKRENTCIGDFEGGLAERRSRLKKHEQMFRNLWTQVSKNGTLQVVYHSYFTGVFKR
ncbi:MAG: GNAT family N-acetyltransferase [Lachnospiraceae bacterium]|nr:GNAT family N-acetyltransferase [Lachnospiraceae bacterium]